MKLMKLLILITLIVLISSSVYGGEYGGEFLRNGIGARALAMGGTYVSIADDATAVYWNPAGVSLLQRPQFVAMYASLYDDLASHQFLGMILPLPGDVALGFSWNHLGVSDIPIFPELEGTAEERYADPNRRGKGVPTGYFSDSENAFYFTFSKTVQFLAPLGWSYSDLPLTFSMGTNLKYIVHNVGEYASGNGIGLDLGVLLQVDGASLTAYDPLGTISMGVNMQDIADTRLSWDTPSSRKDPIESNVMLGMSVRQPIAPFVGHYVTMAVNANTVYEYARSYGIEYEYDNLAIIQSGRRESPPLRLGFALRGGWDSERWLAGAGLVLWKLNLDYVFSQYDLGNTHRMTMLFTF